MKRSLSVAIAAIALTGLTVGELACSSRALLHGHADAIEEAYNGYVNASPDSVETARDRYVGVVRFYNTQITRVPLRFFAGMWGFHQIDPTLPQQDNQCANSPSISSSQP